MDVEPVYAFRGHRWGDGGRGGGGNGGGGVGGLQSTGGGSERGLAAVWG